MLWLDSYQPKTLDELSYHPDITATFQRFVQQQDIPHLILYGPSGAGKETRIKCLLKGLFGESVEKTRADEIEFDGSSTTFNIRSSQYHTDLFASDLGVRDRQAIQLVIKQISAQPGACLFQSQMKETPRYRVFVVHEAHLLTMAAQASLRRTLEKFTANTRVVMLCERLSGIIAPLKSRCYCIRVPAPSPAEVQKVITDVCQKEHYSIDGELLRNIVQASKCNVRAALVLSQMAYNKKGSKPSVSSCQPLWKQNVIECADKVMNVKLPNAANATLEIRELLGQAMVVCIDAQTILEYMVSLLLERCTNDRHRGLVAKAAAHYSWVISRSAGGIKDLCHLEAFTTTAMLSVR